jgi:hypothetical protein
VRTNTLLHSEAFDNAVYNKGTGGSVVADSVVAPDGTTTADAYTFATASSSFAYLSQTVAGTSQIANTFSIYIKRPTGSGSRTLKFAISDVTTTTDSSSNFTITESWQRFQFTRTSALTTGSVGVGLLLGSTGVSIAAGEIIEVWGAQLETGDIATDYIPTTTAAISVGPVANLPRLDYLDSSCPKLLLEPQRTNSVVFSEQFDNAAYTKSETSVTANAIVSPDGNTSADFIIPSVTSGLHSVSLGGASVSSGTHTLSVFAKKGVYKNLLVWLDGHSGGVGVNLDTLAVFRDANNSGYKIEDYGNGWVRISVTCTVVVSSPPNFYIYDNSATPAISWAGNGTDGLYMWGAQLEEGSYSTSYIPTLSAASTRGEDAASKTASLFNQTNFSIFFDYKAINGEGGSAPIFGLTETAGNNFEFYVNGENGLNVYVSLGGGYLFGTAPNAGFTIGSQSKVLVTYNGTTLKYFINGVLYGSAALSLPFTSRTLFFTGYKVTLTSQMLFFPITLTDAECIELTTI